MLSPQIVQRSSDDDDDDSSICKVEGDVIESFLALTLKLSLDDFKPLFYRVFNISTVDQGGKDMLEIVKYFIFRLPQTA